MDTQREVEHARLVLAFHEALNARLNQQPTSSDELLTLAVGQIGLRLQAATGAWVCEAEHIRLVAFHHEDPAAAALLSVLTLRTSSHLALVAQAGLVQIQAAEAGALAQSLGPGFVAYHQARGSAGLVVVPLVSGGERLGALVIGRDGGAAPFRPDDLTLLQQLAAVTSTCLLAARLQEGARTAERLAHARMREDELTGLLNRRGFLEALHARLRNPDGAGELSRLVAVFDLDGFRQVNDGFGHTAGDAVLESLAARLCSSLPDDTLLARIGGDEFAVLVEAHDEEAAAAVVETAVHACTGPLQVLGLSVPISVSVGTVVPAADADRALQHADLALARARRRGSMVTAYDPHLDDPATRVLKQVLDLRRSIADGELVVHYQPVVPVHGSVLRLEALVRRDVSGVLQAPAGWLPMANRAGLMPEVTQSVVEQVVEQLTSWWRQGLEVECAVNIPATVLTPEVVTSLKRRLDAAGLPRRALSVEVTEGDLVGRQTRAALTRCADADIAVAVDDFGTGWSALSYLVDLPLSTLKIDRTFVDGIDGNARRAAVVRAVVDVAHELGLRVVAEGVETRAEANLVVDLGADSLQGYYFGRPTDAATTTDLLRQGLSVLRP